ncbi:MAG: tetratricopeptide repeat protein [Methyloligellaceae bacterium]
MDKPGLELGAGIPGGAVSDEELIKDTSTKDFVPDVIEASKDVPVLVDFWSERCGPCKTLTPILEKATRDAGGNVRLVKMNVDQHPTIFQQISSQLGIQSIPAVIAFHDGRPVDGFVGALPEKDINEFIKRLPGQEGDVEEVLETADQAFNEGDLETALEVYEAIFEEVPDNLNAIAGIAKCHVAKGDLEKAKEVLDKVPPLKKDVAIIANILANIELQEKSESAGELAPLKAKLDADPNDHQARFDLAVALNAAGDREAAMDELLDIMKRKNGWNDDAAKKQLIQFFDAWGATDPLTLSGRQKLSLLLFS